MSNINKLYGLTIVTGNFGSGKTFNIEKELYQAKKDNPNVCIISNIPCSVTDIFYNSLSDFRTIVDFLFQHFVNTNNDLRYYFDHYKDIILVMDETQLYFPARGFADKEQKEIRKKLEVVLTQCRKRNVKIYCATQRSKMVDINFRRLADYIWFYSVESFFFFRYTLVHIFQCGGGVSDLLGEDGVTWETKEDLVEDRIERSFSWVRTDILNGLLVLLNPSWKLWKEKHVTNFICGVDSDIEDNKFDLDFDGFVNKLKRDYKVVKCSLLHNDYGIPLVPSIEKVVDLSSKKVINGIVKR